MAELSSKFIPTTRFRTSCQRPWFTKSLKTLENKKKRFFRAAKLKLTASAWDRYHAAEKIYLNAIRNAKHSFYHADLPKILTNNPRKFWQIINPQETRALTLTTETGEEMGDVECADLFNIAFSSVFTNETDPPLPMPCSSSSLPMPPVTFFPSGILSIIEKIKLSSSAGVDEINSKLLKNTKHFSAAILTLIFSQSLYRPPTV